AAEKLEAWRRDYNEQRPHGTIGNKVSAALMKSAHAASPCC
ncbi:transposase, partial [Chelativorans sp. SCAU2101]